MSRAKNLAEVDDLIKIIRANNVAVELHKGIGGVEVVAQNFKCFFSDILKVTPRLSKLQLAHALYQVHPTINRTEVDQFSACLTLAFGHVRQKSNAMSSGARTNPAVLELGKQLLKNKEKSLATSLIANAKLKAKTTSHASLPSTSSSSHAILPVAKHPMAWSDAEDDEWPEYVASDAVEEILSSQEVNRATSSKATDASEQPYTVVLNFKECKYMRRYADKVVEATMKPGDSGFAVAVFGDEIIQTEMPNLLLEPPVCKRPASKAPKKRPAAMIAQDQASSHDDGDKDPELHDESSDAVDSNDEDQHVQKRTTIQPTASFTKENYKNDSLAFGTCKAEFYSEKSYIRYFDNKSKKWTLLVGTKGQNHHMKLEALVKHAKQANMTKEQIVSIRNQSQ
jgi:hypothetical protein